MGGRSDWGMDSSDIPPAAIELKKLFSPLVAPLQAAIDKIYEVPMTSGIQNKTQVVLGNLDMTYSVKKDSSSLFVGYKFGNPSYSIVNSWEGYSSSTVGNAGVLGITAKYSGSVSGAGYYATASGSGTVYVDQLGLTLQGNAGFGARVDNVGPKTSVPNWTVGFTFRQPHN